MEYSRKITPPSDINQIYLIGRYEFLKHLRSKRLYGILALEILIIVLFLAIPPLTGHDYKSDPASFAEDFYSFTWILLVICATLFAGDALVSEFQNRTGYLLFPNPVKKETIFLGKFMATVAITFAVVILYYLITSIAALVITGGVSDHTLASLGLALLFAVSASAVGYLISSFMKGGTGALVFTFAFLFLILQIVDSVCSVALFKPNFSLSFMATAISCVMQTPYPSDFIQVYPPPPAAPVVEVGIYFPDPSLAAVVAITYVVIALVVGLILFKRREMIA